MRRLEVRIGHLLGPAPQHGGDRRSDQVSRGKLETGLSPKDESQFRNMAEHEDIVEDEIAKSTDEQPASRRKVMDAKRPPEPKPGGRRSVPTR